MVWCVTHPDRNHWATNWFVPLGKLVAALAVTAAGELAPVDYSGGAKEDANFPQLFHPTNFLVRSISLARTALVQKSGLND